MKKNYFITAFAIFILLLSIKLHAQTALGSDRMLMVEVFGSNIFAIDEQGGTTYQRQIDLIDYCQSHGIKTLIPRSSESLRIGFARLGIPTHTVLQFSSSINLFLDFFFIRFIHSAS